MQLRSSLINFLYVIYYYYYFNIITYNYLLIFQYYNIEVLIIINNSCL